MGWKVMYCDNCQKETTFSFFICDECGGLYYKCNNCNLQKERVPENEIYTDKKPCEFH